MSIIAFSRSIGPVAIDCIISENHTSEIEITGNPIETGAEVNDHAYVMPKSVTLEVADDKAAEAWGALMRFQESRIPFFLVTGLSVYKNMLIKSMDAKRDKQTSKILFGRINCQEVIIVGTGTSQGSGGLSSGGSGGANSLGASNPTAQSVVGASTINRVASAVQIGDTASTSISQSISSGILRSVFG